MCTRNGEEFVTAQVASILGQTVPVDEVVVSDDASSDATIARVKNALASVSNPPVAVVLANEEALGVTANFEAAIRACTGDFIFLADQDDEWDAGRVEAALEAFSLRPDVELVFSDARLIDGTGNPIAASLLDTLGVGAEARATLDGPGAFDALLKRNAVTGATVALRRSLLDRALPFPPSWVHDEWLAIVAAGNDGLGLIDAPLISYRQHGRNAIGVQAMSTSVVAQRFSTPRGPRNARLLARAIALGDAWEAMGPTADAVRLAATKEKVAHERARSALPAARIARVPGIVRELRTGRYGRFGRGLADAVRDLVQPL